MSSLPLPPADDAPILALGSSGPWCTVGLRWRAHASAPGDVRLACASERAGNAHSQRLLAMARELLAQAGLALSAVGLIAFDAGPGSFTGLRIGCGLAQGLALGLACSVVGVSSLRALAWPHRERPVFSATDARMGEVYVGDWPSPAGDHTGDLAVITPEACAARLDRFASTCAAGGQTAWVATGDAFARYPLLRERARAGGAMVFEDTFPRGDALAELAAIARAQGLAIPADQAAPLYLRDKVALDVDEQRALRAARA